MQTLLVTGASGFVGHHVVAEASRRGFRVTATGRGARPLRLNPGAEWLDLDLTVESAVKKLPREWGRVVHLAAVSIPSQYASPGPTVASLKMLLNLVAHLASARFLCVSSCHVYAPGADPKSERASVAPAGAYGAAKAMAEIAALSGRHLDVRVARPFNHIGRGMHPDLFVPTLVRRVASLRADEPILMDGRDSVRDFLDVEDICRAYLAILDLDDPGDRIFNVCSSKGTTISDLARLIVAASGRSNAVVFPGRSMSTDDVDILVGDAQKLEAASNWKPRITIEEAVSRLLSSHA